MGTKLGTSINGVILEFSSVSDCEISEKMLSVMSGIIKPDVASANGGVAYQLTSVHISSTSEPYFAHKEGGPHRSGNAVDISKVNNKPITTLYANDEEVQILCDALQVAASEDSRTWENFGPLGCFKTYGENRILLSGEKNAGVISMHKTHLHFSVKA
ncbi:MAG TPA: hypothetical protein PKM58_02295 [Pyrinomonadaceae bacterium]|nr:hypothetical protein [Pyrinomonadaceae bacterium]HNU06649.1 hypothetical protein [Pyrinomonadaceae bacterium]